jgi:transposase
MRWVDDAIKPGKLTSAQRLEIQVKRAQGHRAVDLAKEYNVGLGTIYRCKPSLGRIQDL